MRYLSVCSGIEAASVAWEPLGWEPVAFAETEKFPSAVLAHYWPDCPNLGDITKYDEWPDDLQFDLLAGGTPCQSFSVAGLRKGLADPRGNLALTFLSIVAQYRPRWLVWENVPGVLSDKTGAFGAFLGGLGELGYGFGYRVLDAQYFGVPQRRRRVFVIGHLGDWRCAAAVLFEKACLQGDSGEGPEEEKEIAGTLTPSAARSRGAGQDPGTLIAFPLLGHHPRMNFDETYVLQAGITRENPESGPGGIGVRTGLTYTLDTSEAQIIAFNPQAGGETGAALGASIKKFGALGTTQIPAIVSGLEVRRLTPLEYERLQGFPARFTAIPWRGKPANHCPDTPRYRALGNSMAVPVMRWIGRRIEAVESLMTKPNG